jgi:hypothetical protein
VELNIRITALELCIEIAYALFETCHLFLENVNYLLFRRTRGYLNRKWWP